MRAAKSAIACLAGRFFLDCRVEIPDFREFQPARPGACKSIRALFTLWYQIHKIEGKGI